VIRGVAFLWRWFWRLFFLALFAALIYLAWMPNVRELRTENPTTTAMMELRKRQAGEKGKKLKQKMVWRPLNQISPYLMHAVLIAEDDMFYHHEGFDIEQIKIAIQRDWEEKKFVYGGSTITQQLARTLYLSPHKNLLRKAKEAAITIYLERTLTKKRILELYLNVAEWGNGIYGAEAASRAYFGVSAADLTPDQAVALASILPSPRRWSPTSERAFMARRRAQLLNRMGRAGHLPVEASSATEVMDEEIPLEPLPEPFDPDELSGVIHTAPAEPAPILP
jgi:monofunctional biosynthetic peptidoglycan transglycosylase